MLSETLESGLRGYNIGKKIRDLRASKSMGLVELGDHTGLSSGMLSKIETGKLFPTLPTLLRIAMVFGVGLEHFFDGANRRPAQAIVRKADRIKMPDRPGAEASYDFESLDFPLPDRKLQAFLAHFHDREAPPHAHQGAEVIYVITGTLLLTLAGDAVVLKEGDAIQFDASHPHSYRRQGDADCTAVVVVTP